MSTRGGSLIRIYEVFESDYINGAYYDPDSDVCYPVSGQCLVGSLIGAGVADAHTAPIGLTRDQAIAFEQIAGEGFAHRRFVEISSQQRRVGLVLVALQVQAVEAQAI